MATTNAQRIQFLVAQEDGFTRARLPALYSDFRGLRTTNPEGYAANVAAWRRALAALVRGGMLPAATAAAMPGGKGGSGSAAAAAAASSSATAQTARSFIVLEAGPALLDALQSDRYGRPLALDAVVHEAVQTRDLMPLDAFLRATESIYHSRSWASWAVGTAATAAGLPWHALSWGLRRAGVLAGAPAPATGPTPSSASRFGLGLALGRGARSASDQLVVVANLETAAAAFVDKTVDLRTPFERVWSVAHFRRVFAAPDAVLDAAHLPRGAAVPHVRLSDLDLDVLLTFLARDKGVVAYDGHVVKLRGPHGGVGGGGGDAHAYADASTDAVITEQDRAVAQLRELIDSLTHQTGVLSRRIDDLTASAAAAVSRHNRVAALAALRQKKQAEAALETRFATLAQVEATAAQLAQAADQVHVVQALSAGADALQALHARVGGAEGVAGVVERLRDQMDAADEIGRILVEAGDPAASTAVGAAGLVIDDAEIDDELAALERDELRKADEAGRATRNAASAAAAAADAADAAAEETRRRLAAAGTVPDTAVDTDALEAETAESLRNLSLREPAP